ncbi:hypothetical protein NMS_2532 [Nonlabens marinus S1-08]|uniref:Uncharacterized protein n=1 Tax=Nonlabens marinus S1-08 TaxID=1454201 RepID=W8W0L6_9FLAO|nr:hypothetical protein NMS_2532 [Nonlabens marinus S1-08]
MPNKIEKRPLKSILFTGFLCGLFNVILIAGWDYYDGEPFKPFQYFFTFLIFGSLMGFAFRHKVTKIN